MHAGSFAIVYGMACRMGFAALVRFRLSASGLPPATPTSGINPLSVASPLPGVTMEVDPIENKQRMLRGELYHAFTPELTAARERCRLACARFNNAGHDVGRRKLTELFREYVRISACSGKPSSCPSQHCPGQEAYAARSDNAR